MELCYETENLFSGGCGHLYDTYTVRLGLLPWDRNDDYLSDRNDCDWVVKTLGLLYCDRNEDYLSDRNDCDWVVKHWDCFPAIAITIFKPS